MRRSPFLFVLLVTMQLLNGTESSADTTTGDSGGTSPADEAKTGDTTPQDPFQFTGGQVLKSYEGDDAPTALSSIYDLVLVDAATRQSDDPGAISIAAVQEVIWSNGALGCPAQDMAYPQVLTDGLRIVVSVGDALLDYRTQGIDRVVLCEPWGPIAVE